MLSKMVRRRVPVCVALATTIVAVASAVPAGAQPIEVSPFGGFRFGSGLVQNVSGQPLEISGAPAVGVTVDVPLASGMQVEAAFSHQKADIFVPGQPLGPLYRSHLTVDHWQCGGLQEFGEEARARPFLTGVLGLTRYGSPGENTVRFTAGAGGGVKLFPVPRIGVRLDGRVFATFIDANGSALACGGRGCLVALHLDVAWQAEFTAGLVIRLR